MSSREHLRNHTPASLAALWPDLGLTPAQARRVVARLVGQDRDSLDGVVGLPRRAASALLGRGDTRRLNVVDRRSSLVDPFVKYLFQSDDGHRIETVRIPLERPRFSVCVSSQVGCGLACSFCETGRLGFSRNLEAWEMVEQVLAVRREATDRPVAGVVFQGQGEPLQNYDNVMRAADILRDPCGGRIRGDRITISTVGFPALILRFTDERRPYRLMLSLTSACQAKRERLLPIAGRQPLPELAEALRRHARLRGEPVNLAWVLMAGINTQPEEARAVRRLFPDVRIRMSVIDVNDPRGQFSRADAGERAGFLSALAENGIGFVRRYSGGPDIHAACGMLASLARGGAMQHAPAAAG